MVFCLPSLLAAAPKGGGEKNRVRRGPLKRTALLAGVRDGAVPGLVLTIARPCEDRGVTSRVVTDSLYLIRHSDRIILHDVQRDILQVERW